MKDFLILFTFGALLVCSLLISCTELESEGTPDDSLSIETNATIVQNDKTPRLFRENKAGHLLTQHVKTAFDYAPGAIKRERLSLALLQGQDEELKQQMVSELVETYYRLEEGNYNTRWLVVDLLAQLEFEDALEYLSKLTLAEISSEKMVGNHHFSSQEEEIAIRLAATQGVVWLARNGHRSAEEWLIRIAEASPVQTVKIQAVHGFLLAPLEISKSKTITAYKESELYEDRLAQLRKRLPAEIFALAEIKPASVENLPVPEDVLKSVENTESKETAAHDLPAPLVTETTKPKEQK